MELTIEQKKLVIDGLNRLIEEQREELQDAQYASYRSTDIDVSDRIHTARARLRELTLLKEKLEDDWMTTEEVVTVSHKRVWKK